MHLGNELLTLPVAAGTFVAAGAGVAYASYKVRDGLDELDEKRVPLLGVLGAFVFAAQMVNFPVLPGASGHFVGAALLAIVLGPHAAALGMAAIVIVQCLVFQDGGLVALGANVLNVAIVAPYTAWGAFRLIAPRGSEPGRARLYGASFLAAFASILAAATVLALEVTLAGVLAAPFGAFVGAMASVHAPVGAAEGAITFAALVALARMRPGLVPNFGPGVARKGGWPLGTVIASVLVAAVVTGGFVSLAASDLPDAFEHTVETVAPDGPVPDTGNAQVRIPLSVFEGYGDRWYRRAVSGILGALLVLGMVTAVGRALRPVRRPSTA
jgi:cobalt/nickel transport system permease protein